MNSRTTRDSRITAGMVCAYGLLIAYASLFPLVGWRMPDQPIFSYIVSRPSGISRADVLTNVIAYVPFGALLFWALPMRSSVAASLAMASGALLSFSMETLQMFVPGRTSSPVDLIANMAGTGIGTIAAWNLVSRPVFTKRFIDFRNTWFASGPAVNAGLGCVLLWMASQCSPFLPSMDVSSVRAGLAPAWRTLHGHGLFDPYRAVAYACNVSAVAVLLVVCSRRRRHVRLVLLAIILAVLVVKPFIVSRQVGLEAIVGFTLGVSLVLLPWRKDLAVIAVVVFVVGGLTASALRPAVGPLHSFNWIPFSGEIDDTVSGFGAVLDGIWPFALLRAVSQLSGWPRERAATVAVSACLAVLVFMFEWHQQYVPGRYGDITSLLLAAVGWALPSLIHSATAAKADATHAQITVVRS